MIKVMFIFIRFRFKYNENIFYIYYTVAVKF